LGCRLAFGVHLLDVAALGVLEAGLLAAVVSVELLHGLIRQEGPGPDRVVIAVAIGVAAAAAGGTAAAAAGHRAAAEALHLIVSGVVTPEELGHVLGPLLPHGDTVGERAGALADRDHARLRL